MIMMTKSFYRTRFFIVVEVLFKADHCIPNFVSNILFNYSRYSSIDIFRNHYINSLSEITFSCLYKHFYPKITKLKLWSFLPVYCKFILYIIMRSIYWIFMVFICLISITCFTWLFNDTSETILQAYKFCKVA